MRSRKQRERERRELLFVSLPEQRTVPAESWGALLLEAWAATKGRTRARGRRGGAA